MYVVDISSDGVGISFCPVVVSLEGVATAFCVVAVSIEGVVLSVGGVAHPRNDHISRAIHVVAAVSLRSEGGCDQEGQQK